MRLTASPHSVTNGEPSWLAILETLGATALCWYVVWYGDSRWPVLLPLGMVPLLLLRSPASTALGARWFADYLDDKTHVTPTGTPLLFWGIMVPLIVGVTSLCTTLLVDRFLPHQTDWALFIRATLVGVAAMWIAITIAVAGAMEWAMVIALTVVFALALGAARAGVGGVAFAWALAVTVVGMVATPLALLWMGAAAGEGALVTAMLLAGIPWIIGIWLRSLGVRLLATLRHPWQGLQSLPDNWRRLLWAVDSRHPPELVPGLAAWTPSFSVTAIRGIIRTPGVMRKLFGVLAFGCFFLPAILYRWGLKSTLWLYWPLLYLETLPSRHDPQAMEQWRLALHQSRREQWRRRGTVVLAGVVLYLLFQPVTPDAALSINLLAIWQGGAAALGLLSLVIAGISRHTHPPYWLRGLVRLRNGDAIVLVLVMVYHVLIAR
ncbi:MAG: hypothetical protein H7838_03605 [Magnetococcus sp. DMHC-8]